MKSTALMACCAALAATALAAENGKQLKGPEWAHFKGNAGFTGVSPDASVKPPLKLLWSYHTGADGSGDSGAGPTVAGGKLFLPIAMKRSLLALDAATGDFLWEYANYSIDVYMAPTYADGRVYLWMRRSSKHYVLALDAETGKEVWKVELNKKGVHVPRTGLPLVDGKLYCVTGGDAPAVLALSAKDGKELWRAPLEGTAGLSVTPACVAGGRLFMGAHSWKRGQPGKGFTVALDAKDGKELWRNKGLNCYRPPSSDGRSVAVTSAPSTLSLLDAKTGKALWSVKGGGRRTPTLTDKLVMIKSYGPYFDAHDRKDGTKLWTFKERGASGCCTPLVSGKYAYFGSGSPGVGGAGFCVHFEKVRAKGLGWGLFAVDLETGKHVWRFQTGYNVCGEPAIAYGRLYAESRGGWIYCFVPAKQGEPTTPQAKDKSPNAPADAVKKLLAEKLPAPRPGRDWPMWGGTPARAGLPMTLNAPLTLGWKFDTGGRVMTEAAIVGGKVYAGSDSGKIICVDGRSGGKAWEFDAKARVRCSPAVAGGVVYCGADDGKFYALDAAGGTKKWVFEAGGPVRGSPAVVGGTVLFGADDHNIYMLDSKTGKKLWNFKTRYYRNNAPAVHGETVYVAEGLDWAVALEVATGKQKWRRFKPKPQAAVVYYKDMLWVRGSDTAGLDPKTGKIVRYCYGAPAGYSRPAFTGNTMLLRAARFLLNETYTRGGFPRPKRGPYLRGSPRLASRGTPLVLGEKFCFASAKGEVILTKTDGNRLWSFAMGGSCHTSPVAADGLLVVGSDDGKLYAFRGK